MMRPYWMLNSLACLVATERLQSQRPKAVSTRSSPRSGQPDSRHNLRARLRWEDTADTATPPPPKQDTAIRGGHGLLRCFLLRSVRRSRGERVDARRGHQSSAVSACDAKLQRLCDGYADGSLVQKGKVPFQQHIWSNSRVRLGVFMCDMTSLAEQHAVQHVKLWMVADLLKQDFVYGKHGFFHGNHGTQTLSCSSRFPEIRPANALVQCSGAIGGDRAVTHRRGTWFGARCGFLGA